LEFGVNFYDFFIWRNFFASWALAAGVAANAALAVLFMVIARTGPTFAC
jgi:hypothetical protein